MVLEMEKGSNRLHSVEISLWRKLWTLVRQRNEMDKKAKKLLILYFLAGFHFLRDESGLMRWSRCHLRNR